MNSVHGSGICCFELTFKISFPGLNKQTATFYGKKTQTRINVKCRNKKMLASAKVTE